MQGGSFAASPINVSRLTFRRMTTAPDASRPTTLQTFLPRSTPRTEIVAITLPPSDLRRAYDAHAAEQERPDILRLREDWFESQLDLDPERLVFIDETWASTNMARRYGRAPKGERLIAAVPHGHIGGGPRLVDEDQLFRI